MRSGNAARARSLQVVVVLDGLRPDLLDAGLMPILRGLASEGVVYSAARAIAMPVTLVSAASLVTGAAPGATGLLSRDFYGPRRAGSPGRVPLARTLGQHLAARGDRLVTLTTASSLIGRVVNNASCGQVAINLGGDGDLPLAQPAAVERDLLDRFGPPPSRRAGRHGSALGAIGYALRSLTEWLLPELAPDAVLLWCAEPDQTQHRFGVCAPESRDVLADLDVMLAELWEALRFQRRFRNVELIVCADHGFSALEGVIELPGQLVEAGLKDHEDSDDIAVASNGLGLVRAGAADVRRLADVAEWAVAQPWIGGVFAGEQLGGMVDALPIEHLQLNGHRDAPELVLAPAWSSEPNEFGTSGRSFLLTDRHYPAGRHSGHGTLSPHELHVPLVVWGSRIRRGVTLDTPAGIVDIAPTLLALAGHGEGQAMGGRVLTETFIGGRAAPSVSHEVVTTRAGSTTFALELSAAGAHRYLDRGWRA